MSTYRDLALLMADKDIEATIRGLLSRPQALGLREISCDSYVHPDHDPGCLRRGHEFLRPFLGRYRHALVVFDREGCGKERVERAALEAEVERSLSAAGWADRAAAVAIDPEVEVWVWANSPHVELVLGWQDKVLPLKAWLEREGWLRGGAIKPDRPKKARVETLRRTQRPRSSALFLELARRVKTDKCVDPAFLKLKRVLRTWFPPLSLPVSKPVG